MVEVQETSSNNAKAPPSRRRFDTSDEASSLLSHESQDVLLDIEPMIPLMSPSNAFSLVSPSVAVVGSHMTEEDGLKADHVRSIDEQEPEPVVADEVGKLLRLIYPVAGTYILECMPGIVCIMLVGHMDSPHTKQYVDAAVLSTMFTNVSALSIGFGLSSALDTLCSQANGAGRPMKIGIYLQTSILVVGSFLIPLFLINWYAGQFLALLGQDEAVAQLAGEFSRYTVFGIPFLFLYEMFRKVLQAQNIVTPMVFIAVANNIVNIFGGYYLTYNTSMGFHGAALSRTLGYMMLVVLLIPYFWISGTYKKWWPGWDLREAVRNIGIFLKLGVPGMLMMAMQWWAYEILAIMAGLLPDGVVSISAHAVLMNVAQGLYMPFIGISVSANVRVGNCLGANLPKTAQLVSRIALTMSFCLGFVCSAVVLLFRFDIPALIINDPRAIERAAQTLLVLVPYEIVDGANCVIQGIFRGTGQQDIAAKINAVAFYVIGIPLGAVSAFYLQWNVEGLWVGFGSGLWTALTICGVILYRSSWLQMAKEAQERTAH